MWTPSERYPDPSVRVLDPRGAGLIPMNASVERLYTGTRWSEGPVWFGDGHYLVWSDIPNNRMLRWTEETGAVSEFRKPSNFSNGNTRDRQGRLVSCEHFTRRVTRTEYDGTITVLADKFEGKRLNSPNDVVVKSDGSVWFSDPAFGILSDYEGERAPSELPMAFYRLDPATGKLTVVADGMDGPNGLCFSPDEKLLYVVESASRPRRTWVFDVVGDKLANKRPFADCGELGTPDGWRCDERGNVWA
ncbi:MAG: SMP-30/gluconolactonase/LRE family protein, partial [Alphaproteobacteria bacterium]|nr:SMP-30/gluconolactonase/LRE family protein [Alphaproteobacteria bacterium]